jgi:hypothetical protein
MEAAPLEPWLADMVDAAVAPYRGTVSDEELAWMREQLAARLREDPEMARLASDARGRPVVDESGKLVRRDVLDAHGEDTLADGHDARAAGGRGDR